MKFFEFKKTRAIIISSAFRLKKENGDAIVQDKNCTGQDNSPNNPVKIRSCKVLISNYNMYYIGLIQYEMSIASWLCCINVLYVNSNVNRSTLTNRLSGEVRIEQSRATRITSYMYCDMCLGRDSILNLDQFINR